MIQGESGGSETVVNTIDSNAAAGHPSAGLLQFIEETFKHYCVKPFTTWKAGFDQLLALFNMDDWQAEVDKWQIYHSWSPNGNPRLKEVSTTTVQKTSQNTWGWPFPSVGEGHFMSAQLFEYTLVMAELIIFMMVWISDQLTTLEVKFMQFMVGQ